MAETHKETHKEAHKEHKEVHKEAHKEATPKEAQKEHRCIDQNCYRHGTIRVRGVRIGGRVVSAKTRHTVIVERETTIFLSKYKRRAKKRSRIPAHNPPCINAKVGDLVNLGETRKISKTKAFTVLDVMHETQAPKK